MIVGLDPRVSVIFTSTASHILVRTPYNKEFIWALGANDIEREFLKSLRAYKIASEWYDDVMKLLRDYFPRREQ